MPVIVEKEQQQKPCINENGDDDIEQHECPTHGNGGERVTSPLSLSEEGSLLSEEGADGEKRGTSPIIDEIETVDVSNIGETVGVSNIGETDEFDKKKGSKKEDDKENGEFRTISLQLILPGVNEPIDIMHIAKDTANDLLQYAFEHQESCYRTCLAVYFKGRRIDNFIEIGSVKGLVNGSVIELVEVPYAEKDVLIHIQRFQELLTSNFFQQCINCIGGQSLSVLPAIIGGELDVDDNTNQPPSNFTGLHPPSYCIPPNYQQPSTTTTDNELLDQFYPEGINTNSTPIKCLKSLRYSSWNPPTPSRKYKGDILYVDIVTLESDRLCITATPSGFYVNRAVSDDVFDPHPKKSSLFSRHLFTLLQQISPLFKKNYDTIQLNSNKRHIFEMFPVPYPVYPWIVPKFEHQSQIFHLDENLGLRVAADELLVGQLRDWNEEFQSTRDLPVDTIQQRMYRDRGLFKVHSDFIQSAVKGAMAAIDGQLHPLNPADPDRHHMYLWNNIFFSTGFDGRGHFKDFGGEEAGHNAANYDLQGVSILEKLNIPDLFTLGAVLIDYRGYRVFAQTIVPGLLQRDHDTSIIYGSMDNGKTFNKNEKFNKLMVKCGQELNLRPHQICTDLGEIMEVPVSVEVKGIEGNDGRQYALDMFRVLPPDANYADPGLVSGEVDSFSNRPTANQLGLRHKLYLLRQELVEGYVGTVAFQLHLTNMQKAIRIENNKEKNNGEETGNGGDKETNSDEPTQDTPIISDQEQSTDTPTISTEIQDTSDKSLAQDRSPNEASVDNEVVEKTSINNNGAESNNVSINGAESNDVLVIDGVEIIGEKPDILELADTDDTTTTIVNDESDKNGGDLLMNLYDDYSIQFNADIFTAGLKNADTEEVKMKDRQRCRHLTQYLVSIVIPKFVKECLYLNVMPLDGTGLKTQLHSRGINMRYLGRIAVIASTREDLCHLYKLCISEMILRVAKRKLRKLLLETPLQRTSVVIINFLNCLLGDKDNTASPLVEEATVGVNPTSSVHKKKHKKKKVGGVSKDGSVSKSATKESLTTVVLWKYIKEDIKLHYRYDTEYCSINEAIKGCGFSKTALLRELCIKTGLQINLRQYDLTMPTPFTEEDIIALVPVIKHTNYRPIEATGIYDLAYARLNGGNLKFAHELLTEAIQLSVQVYGPLHTDIARCYRLLGRLHNLTGEMQLAVTYQYKATLIYERLLGVDNSTTVSAYFNLGQYCSQAGKIGIALKLFYRVKYLTLLLHGQDHPEVGNVDFQIAVCLCDLKQHSVALKFLYNSLSLQQKYYGKGCVAMGISHTLAANALAELGEFREALRHEKIAFSIYRERLGLEHEKTKRSSDCLKVLTERAVFVVKQMKMVTDSQSTVGTNEIVSSWWDKVSGTTQQQQQQQQQSSRSVRQHNVNSSQTTSQNKRKNKSSTSGTSTSQPAS